MGFPQRGSVGLLLLVSIAILLVGGATFIYVNKKDGAPQTNPTSNPIVLQANTTESSPRAGWDAPKIASDTKLLDGRYFISANTWSPNSDNVFLTTDGDYTDFGLPSYITYDVFNLKKNRLISTNLKDNISSTEPHWVGDDSLVTEQKNITLQDSDKVMVNDDGSTIPSGYELLEKIKYYNPYTKKWENGVNRLSFSQDKKYAAFIGRYDTEASNNPQTNDEVFVVPEGAQSLNDIINFGDFDYGVESSYPSLVWSSDDKYLIVGKNELYDVPLRKVLLPNAGDGGYHRRFTYLSADETKVLVIANFQDRVEQQDYQHETVRVFIKNLQNGNETELLSYAGSESDAIYVDGGFSPDGKFVVFNFQKQLWVANTDTGEKKQLTITTKNYKQPRWSPDGNKVIYTDGNTINLLMLGGGAEQVP